MQVNMIAMMNEFNPQVTKVVELESVPRRGEKFAVQGRLGRVVYEVDDVCWEQGKRVVVLLSGVGVATTSLGSEVLKGDGWLQGSPPEQRSR